jgi:hypothetical protein
MSSAVTESEAPEETLAWEAKQRRPSAIAAIAAGVLLIVSRILSSTSLTDVPQVGALDGLRDALGQPLSNGAEGLLTPTVLFFDSKATQILLFAVMEALAFVGIGLFLGFLYRAVKARNPTFTRLAVVVSLVAAGLYAVGVLVLQVGIVAAASEFASGDDRSTAAAHDAISGGSLVAGQALLEIGRLLLGLGVILVALNAMRVGLLTRFLGILGIIAGVLFILPLGVQFVVQSFWLVAAGVLILRQGTPAWRKGIAVPWPTQQSLREAREAASGSTRVPAPAAEAAPEQPETAAAAARRRKRKRR